MVKVIPEKIQDEIVNFLESFHQLKPFFDEDGWNLCMDSMMNKRKQCPSCDSLINGTLPVVCCSACKNWFHTSCEQATESELNRRQWHCKDCSEKKQIKKN